MMLTETQVKQHFAPHMAAAEGNKYGELFKALPLDLKAAGDSMFEAAALDDIARKELVEYLAKS